MSKTMLCLIILAVLWAIGLVTANDIEDEQAEIDQYCDMVRLHQQSNGAHGWPAYDEDIKCPARATADVS